MKGFKKVVSSWAHKKESKALLEGKQQLFLRAKEDLTAEQEQERASIGLQLLLLETAWQLKEALRSWYATATVATAAAELDTWVSRVRELDQNPCAKRSPPLPTGDTRSSPFSSFCPSAFPSSFVEGKNNRTKALMRQAYGYRNRHHLRLRLLLEDVA